MPIVRWTAEAVRAVAWLIVMAGVMWAGWGMFRLLSSPWGPLAGVVFLGLTGLVYAGFAAWLRRKES